MNRPHFLQRTLQRLAPLWSARRAADRTPIRQAWTTLGTGSGAEARAGALLRQSIVQQSMTDTQLAAVRARLRRGRVSSVRGRRLVSIAAGLAVMLLAGALLAAAGHFLGWSERAPALLGALGRAVPHFVHRAAGKREQGGVVGPRVDRPPPTAEPVPVPPAAMPPDSTAGQAAVADAIGVAPSQVLTAPGPRPAASEARAIAKAPRSRARVARRTAMGEGVSLAEESRLLALALRELRQDNDPTKALATLDDHARRFGQQGALGVEADTARVEALLRLRRHTEALVRLDEMALAPVGPGRALLAARAELRAEDGRCPVALLDFDRLLQRAAAPDAIVERAFHGRASCRVQTGDIAGARADLETYLARFPDGRFAADTRAALSVKGRRGSSHQGEGGGGGQ